MLNKTIPQEISYYEKQLKDSQETLLYRQEKLKTARGFTLWDMADREVSRSKNEVKFLTEEITRLKNLNLRNIALQGISANCLW